MSAVGAADGDSTATLIAALVARHGFKPLPVEGTLFVETYRSPVEVAPGRSAGTVMLGLYCEEPRSESGFHRLSTDEIWHFHAGDPLRLILLYPDGTSRDVILGPDPLRGHEVQWVVPAGVWQAGHLIAGGRFAMYGCTLAPGFDPGIFEGGTVDGLLATHPDREADIRRYSCRETRMG
jgi:predicted cupin superfamily sugar epimerase